MNPNSSKSGTVPLDWKEVWYTNCPVVSASNVDESLGWVREEFMRSHGYTKNDFDLETWAAPQFLEQAAKELIEERWKKVTAYKLPEPTALRLG